MLLRADELAAANTMHQAAAHPHSKAGATSLLLPPGGVRCSTPAKPGSARYNGHRSACQLAALHTDTNNVRSSALGMQKSSAQAETLCRSEGKNTRQGD